MRLLQVGLRSASADTRRSVYLSIHRSWISRIGTGFRKWSFSALPAGDDEAGVFEDPEVLHDAEARHLQLRLELGERAAVTHEEPIEQEARVGSASALNTRSSSFTSEDT